MTNAELERLIALITTETDAAGDTRLPAFSLYDVLTELLAYRTGGLTEEILRRGDGYIKLGRECSIVPTSEVEVLRVARPPEAR